MDGVKELINIRRDVYFFKLISLVSIGFAVIALLVFAGLSYKMYQKYHQSIYILDEEGKSFEAALAGNQYIRTDPEVYDHIMNFHRLFFEIDQFNYTSRINKAVDLIGQSGKDLYLKFRANGWYAGIINNNLKLRIVVDSLSINLNNLPYKGYIDFRIIFEPYDSRDTRKVGEKRMIARDFEIYTVDRSRKNPHGLLIENYALENKN